MSTNDKKELAQLLEYITKNGFQPIGMIFYDSKLQLLGLAPLEKVPEAFVELIGNRLGGAKGSISWTEMN